MQYYKRWGTKKKNGQSRKPVIPLRFSKSGDPEIERRYATHYKAVVVDGMYQQTPELYRPVYTDFGQLWAFRQVKPAPENYLATTEISVEGNCNKIDGIINNEAPKPSLRDNLKQCQQEADAAKPAGTPDRPSQGQDR